MERSLIDILKLALDNNGIIIYQGYQRDEPTNPKDEHHLIIEASRKGYIYSTGASYDSWTDRWNYHYKLTLAGKHFLRKNKEDN